MKIGASLFLTRTVLEKHRKAIEVE